MPIFFYKAKRGPHEVVEGELDAPDEHQAIKILDGLGLVPVAIRVKQGVSLPKKTVKKTTAVAATGGIRRRQINDFIRSLANMIKGNVPILKGLTLLETQATGALKGVAAGLVDAVRQGASLSQAMERYPSVFPFLMIGMARGGEAAGLLGEMLEKTADHEEKAEEMHQKIKSAMAYPLFVLAMGAISIFILLVYFMPRLMETYLSNNQALPWPTEATLAVGNFFSTYWYWILGVFALVYAVIRQKAGSSEGPWDGIKLQLPFFGSLVQKSSVASFNRTLGLLLGHGVPLVKGVPLAAETVTNRVMRDRLKAIEEKLIKRGISLGTALTEVPDYPPTAVALTAVGEESGNLAVSLNHIATQYERDVEIWLKTFSTLVEPVLIFVVGGVIGFIVFAMLMPIFQMDVLMEK